MAEYIDRAELMKLVENQAENWGEDYDAWQILGDIEDFPAADVAPVVQREAVMQALNKYFSIGDSYTYELTRVKEAVYIGTMTLDDFEEWNEDNISDLCDYLMKEIFCPNCGADMREVDNG